MKNTTFVTTFSIKGYKQYGRAWIESFVKNTSDVKAVIYTDFDLKVSDPRITILNFQEAIPEHKAWTDSYNEFYQRTPKQKQLGFKFSYKSFVMLHALKNIPEYVVWLDADCVFKPNIYNNLAKTVLNDKFIAVQVVKVAENDWWKTEEHIESGIVIFDADHKDKDEFIKTFKFLYQPTQISTMELPYDGFILKRAIYNINYEDLLPEGYTILDLDPNLTFIHPELKTRFIHNIGHKND